MFATEKENQLYPTPTKIIKLMVDGLTNMRDVNGRYGRIKPPLLEPSAGFGGILNYLKETREEAWGDERNRLPHHTDCYAMEIDPNLRLVLQGKGYKVLCGDFLSYPLNERKFATIIMNPPFNDGIDHLFHAWELLESDGHLCCLLNAESILSPTNKPRQRLVDLIDLYGHYQELGQAFKDSDHPTDVNVVAIFLRKPKDENENIFDGVEFEKDYTDWSEISPDMLVKSDAIADLVSRYNGCVEILRKRHQDQQLLNIYLKGVDCAVKGSHDRVDESQMFEMKYSVEDQVEVLKSKFWATVFSRTKIGMRTTESYRKQFEQGSQIQAHMAFTEQNIKDVLELFLCNQGEIMEQCIVSVFDQCTRYHEKNIIHEEGWKTNKSSRLNKRIIFPYGVRLSFSGRIDTNYESKDFYDDLDKACCFLVGKSFEKIKSTYCTLSDHLQTHPYDEVCHSEFFKIRCYKKGTIHLDFLDLKILEDFNKIVASVRGKEIGPNY